MADEVIVYTPDQRSSDAIKAVMSTRPGRRYVWEILARCGLMQTSFNPDALVLSFNEGQRNVGLSIFNDIDTNCSEAYLLMIKEAKEDELYDREHTDTSGDTFRSE